MKGVLFLGGGGDADVSARLDKMFFSNLNESSRILYIPLAWAKVTNNEWFCSLMKRYVDIPKSQIDTLFIDGEINDLDQYDAVYIGGGNTYRLLDYILQHKLDIKLKGFLAQGKYVFGGSAGAIIFGKTLLTVNEEQHDYLCIDALNLCNGLSFRCHYKEQDYDLCQKILTEVHTPFAAIPENAGLIYDQNQKLISVVGEVTLFSPSGISQLTV